MLRRLVEIESSLAQSMIWERAGINMITESNKCFFIFNTRDLLSESKRLNLRGTYQGEPYTRPPSCSSPRQLTISDPDLAVSDYLSPPGTYAL